MEGVQKGHREASKAKENQVSRERNSDLQKRHVQNLKAGCNDSNTKDPKEQSFQHSI